MNATPPKTIGIDVRPVRDRRAGIGFYTECLLGALQRVRLDERFVLLGDGQTRWDLLPTGEGFEHRPVPGASWLWHFRAARMARAFDLYHSPSSLFVPRMLPRGKAVLTVHDLAPLHMEHLSSFKTRLAHRLFRSTIEHLSHVLAVSKYTADDLASCVPGFGGDVHAVPLAPRPLTVLDPVGSAPHPGPYFLFVGTLEPRKNLPFLLRAYRKALASSPGLPDLVVVGQIGWKNQAFEALRTDPQLRDRLHCKGYVSDRELEGYYRHATAFVYPSLFEGFGLPVVEAMARGIPVITSSTSSLLEVGGDAVLYVDPHDERTLVSALQKACDPEVGTSLRHRGLRQAERFSWDETARRTLEVYRMATGERPHRSPMNDTRRTWQTTESR